MPDISQLFGNDLVVDGSGDIAVVDGAAETVQRVLRRLLTAPANSGQQKTLPADDIWNRTYGAGLRRMIGQAKTVAEITGVIRSQLFLEAGIAQSPAPTITVTPSTSGVFNVNIAYNDASTGAPMLLNFDAS